MSNAIRQFMIGRKFGRLTVIRELPERDKWGDIYYECKCCCPRQTIIKTRGSNLRKGLTTSCGCYKRELLAKNRTVDFTGFNNGYITALRPTEKRIGPNIVWICKCHNCGREFELGTNMIRSQMSCGKCDFQRNLTIARLTKYKTPEEKELGKRFSKMLIRCYDKKCKDYPDYGGRGIYICKEWTDDRDNFVRWGIQNGFKMGMSIDRIDNDGPYAPWNCRWANSIIQANNKRGNRLINVYGHSATIANWARALKRKPETLYNVSMCDLSGNCIREYIAYILTKKQKQDLEMTLQAIEEINHGRAIDT